MKIRQTGPAGHRTVPMRTMLAWHQSIIGASVSTCRVPDGIGWQTWRLYPTHCAIPEISDTEQTIIQATTTLTALGGTVPSSTSEAIA